MSAQQPDIASLKSILRSLQELEKHPGWLHVRGVIEKDVLNASFALADDPLMTEKETDFRRGAIFAARGTTQLLPKLINQLDGEIQLASAQLQQTQTP